VVLTSSAAAYRPARGHTYVEDDALYDEGDRVSRFATYGQSKALAEREAWRVVDRLGVALSTARPHAIHGAFDAHGPSMWMGRLLGGPVGAWATRMELPSVYAGDLAD